MIGMTFQSFLSLLVISAVCAALVNSMFKLTVLNMGEAYLSQWMLGWIGAWLGSAVVGHWGWMVPGTDVYLVPAVAGSIASVYLMTVLLKSAESLFMPVSLHETSTDSGVKVKIA